MDKKQIELDAILEITQAINVNVREEDLYRIFLFTCLANLSLSKFALAVTENGVASIKISQNLKPSIDELAFVLDEVSKSAEPKYSICLGNQCVVLPVRHKENILGFLLIEDIDENKFDDSDLNFIKTLANILMVAIENKRLFRSKISQEKLNNELKIAKEVQQNLVPHDFPKSEDFEVYASYVPHDSVGGDYYDFIRLESGEYLFCVADVSGKGVPAALIMSNFQATLHTMVRQTSDLEAIVNELNYQVYQNAKGSHFITFFVGIINIDNCDFTYINAGHNPPLLLNGNGDTNFLTEGTMVLGVFEELPFLNKGVGKFKKGDLLFLYTDGVTEVFNKEQEEFGEEALEQFLQNQSKSSSLVNVSNGLVDTLNKFRGEEPFSDDLTTLMVRWLR